MSVEDLLVRLDEAVAKGPEAAGEARALINEALDEEPQLLGELVARYTSGPNTNIAKQLAAKLFDVATDDGIVPLDETSANYIWALLANMPDWENVGAINNALGAIQQQAARDLPWAPREARPPVLTRILLHSLSAPADGTHDLQGLALDIVFKLDQWAGGLAAVFSDAEREEIRAEVARQGIEAEAKPLLDLL